MPWFLAGLFLLSLIHIPYALLTSLRSRWLDIGRFSFLSFFFFLCVLWTAANERDLYPLILTFNLTFQLNNITYMECGGHWVRINMLRVTPILIKKKNSKWGRFDCLANKGFIYCIAKISRRLQWESRINRFFFECWILLDKLEKNSWFNRFTLLMGQRQKRWLKLIRKLHKLPIFY